VVAAAEPSLPATGTAAARRQRLVELSRTLDQQQLPGPLRMLAFWDDDFTLESDWYRWSLRPGEPQ